MYLPIDPVEILRINDKYRYPNVENEDLYTLSNLENLGSNVYTYPVPTFVPTIWPFYKLITQKEYILKFNTEFPIAAKILKKISKNIVIAGGAAAWPFGESHVKANDIDFFIVGIDSFNEEKLWEEVNNFFDIVWNIVIEEYKSKDEFIQILSPGVLTLIIYSPTKDEYGYYRTDKKSKKLKIQLILRAYPSISSLLHAFDIGSACVAFNGKTTYTTTFGAYSQIFRVNIVNPAYRSTTYENRLIKYFKRYYAISLPFLSSTSLNNKILKLPYLTFLIRHSKGNRAMGTFNINISQENSDYEPSRIGIWESITTKQCVSPFINLNQLVSKKKNFVIIRSYTIGGRGIYDSQEDYKLPIKNIISEKGKLKIPELQDVFSKEQLKWSIERIVNGIHNTKNGIKIDNLKKLGLSNKEIEDFVLDFTKICILNPKKNISETKTESNFHCLDLKKIIQNYKNRIIDSYNSLLDQPIEWFIVSNPERQYTASINPIISNPIDWYGKDNFTKEQKNSQDTMLNSFFGFFESQQLVENKNVSSEYCSICFEIIEKGSPNSIVLPCKHAFHWNNSGTECGGLFSWINSERNDCPICRRSLISDFQNE